MAPKSRLKLVAPTSENRAVGLSRRPNSEFRSREHLTPTEVEALIDAAKTNRYGLRDATMILVAYRHGFRAAEICYLEWSAIDFDAAIMQVRRSEEHTSELQSLRHLV